MQENFTGRKFGESFLKYAIHSGVGGGGLFLPNNKIMQFVHMHMCGVFSIPNVIDNASFGL